MKEWLTRAWPWEGGRGRERQGELGFSIWQCNVCTLTGRASHLLQTGKFKQPQEGRLCTSSRQM